MAKSDGSTGECRVGTLRRFASPTVHCGASELYKGALEAVGVPGGPGKAGHTEVVHCGHYRPPIYIAVQVGDVWPLVGREEPIAVAGGCYETLTAPPSVRAAVPKPDGLTSPSPNLTVAQSDRPTGESSTAERGAVLQVT